MPRRRRSNLSEKSRNAIRLRNIANEMTEEERKIKREKCRVGMARFRESLTPEQVEAARETARRHRAYQKRKNLQRTRKNVSSVDLNGSAFLCLDGKMNVPLLTLPPEPLHSLLHGKTAVSRRFLANTLKYNGLFQMPSFGADIEEHGFDQTFKLEEDLENVQYKMVDSPQILTKDVVSLKSPEVKMEIEEPLIYTTEAIKEEVESQEIDELNKVLDDSIKPSEENEFNINRSQLEADKLEQEPIEKYQMLTTELKCIKEKCQILESENTGLSRKVEMYEKKLKHSKAYHKEILNRDANLRIAMADIQEMVEKLREEQIRALELSEKTKLAEEALEKLEKLSQNSQKIKEEKADYEESFVKKIEAKCDKFEELMEINKDIHEPNLLHRIIFAQWQKSRSHYEEVMRQKNDIIAKLSELLNYEKLSDRKLNDIYEETNKSHEQIQQLGQSSEYEIVRIKTEINDLEEST